MPTWAQRLWKDAALSQGTYNCIKFCAQGIYYVEYNNIIFSQIISGSFMRTQNSIKENESKYERSDKVGENLKFQIAAFWV